MKPITGKEAEEPCKNAYDSYLKSRYPSAHVCWDKNKQDPPDFWLTLKDRKYAVEVITLMEYLGSDARSRRDIYGQLGSFKRRLERKLEGIKPSNGVCCVHICRFLPRNDRDFGRKLLDDIVEVVTRVCTNGDQREEPICDDDEQHLATVRLVPSQKNRIDIWDPPFGVFPAGQARETLSRALKHKTEKLRKAGVKPPWVLLLWLDTCSMDLRHYEEIVDFDTNIENFETVFAVARDGHGVLLTGAHRQNASKPPAPTTTAPSSNAKSPPPTNKNDQLVYDLYGLSKEEIAIVEANGS